MSPQGIQSLVWRHMVLWCNYETVTLNSELYSIHLPDQIVKLHQNWHTHRVTEEKCWTVEMFFHLSMTFKRKPWKTNCVAVTRNSHYEILPKQVGWRYVMSLQTVFRYCCFIAQDLNILKHIFETKWLLSIFKIKFDDIVVNNVQHC